MYTKTEGTVIQNEREGRICTYNTNRQTHAHVFNNKKLVQENQQHENNVQVLLKLNKTGEKDELLSSESVSFLFFFGEISTQQVQCTLSSYTQNGVD